MPYAYAPGLSINAGSPLPALCLAHTSSSSLSILLAHEFLEGSDYVLPSRSPVFSRDPQNCALKTLLYQLSASVYQIILNLGGLKQ